MRPTTTFTCLIILFILLFVSGGIYAQKDAKLAQYYYQSGEYEKSSHLYKKLYEGNFNDYYFGQYIESLMAMENYDEAITSINKQLKRAPGFAQLYVVLGNVYERQALPEKAQEAYELAIKNISAQRGIVSSVGNSFIRLNKYDLALQAYEKGTALFKNDKVFAYNLSDLYRRKGDIANMIHYYLISNDGRQNYLHSSQSYFARYLNSKEEYDLLRKKLYEFAQIKPENIYYPEMIQWVFIQNKEYKKALRQAKSLDMRLSENGQRVYSMGQIAINDNDFQTAIDAFTYITEQKDKLNKYYIDSKKELLNTKRKKITINPTYSKEDLFDLKNEYEIFLQEFGRDRRTALIIKELAELEALYLSNIDGAIEILNELVDMKGLNKFIQSMCKLSLADYYLINDEIWEATLLYSQVDKDFVEGQLGEKARYKNARLSYYNGDFDWAQKQFDILKSATSKLISNDAIEMSVFIMDNMNLDTTTKPLQMYAQAELLIFQNKFEESVQLLDQIIQIYPGHSLEDDILYAKAQINQKLQKYSEAIELYEMVISKHSDEIRCDNALFHLAKLYENTVTDKERAKEYYEKLFVDHPDSTFAVEARKRYRLLRGDQL